MIFKNDDVTIYSKYLLCTVITIFCVHQFGFARKRGRLMMMMKMMMIIDDR